ncbi:MAG: hypothetical protein QXT13_06495 [Pyrobaculum sp.]
MREDVKYAVQIAPAYATYLRVSSGTEAMKRTAQSCIEAECGEKEAYELKTASLTSPEIFTTSENPVKRSMAYAWYAVDAGNREMGILQLVNTSESVINAFITSMEHKFTSLFNSSATLFAVPLILLVFWSVGMLAIDAVTLALLMTVVAAASGLLIYMSMYRDIPWHEAYTFAAAGSPAFKAIYSSVVLSLLLMSAAGYILLVAGLPAAASFGIAAFLLHMHLRLSGRYAWYKFDQLVAFLNDVAGAFKSGVPLKAALGTILAKYPAARDLAFHVRRPSNIYKAAHMLYTATTFAGPNDLAIGVLRQFVLSVIRVNKTVSNNALMVIAVFIAATLVIVRIILDFASIFSQLPSEATASMAITPPPVEDILFVTLQIVPLIVSLQMLVALIPRGAPLALAIASVAGIGAYVFTYLTIIALGL